MCLVCLDYIKGNLTATEYLKNRREFGEDVPHDEEAGRKAFAELVNLVMDEHRDALERLGD